MSASTNETTASKSSSSRTIMRTFSTRPASLAAIALVGVPSDEASARLAWRPDQRGFFAVEAPGAGLEKITSTFFAVSPHEEFQIDRALMSEAGYTLFRTVASWRCLHAALVEAGVLPIV